MPIRDVNNLKLWQRRSGRESLFHWILWLIGIATFAYFPKQFKNYISKLNCFCYDAQTLGPTEQGKYLVVLLKYSLDSFCDFKFNISFKKSSFYTILFLLIFLW